DIASRAAKQVCDEGRGVGPGGLGVYLDFSESIQRLGQETIASRYSNLFDMYSKITGENPYQSPMRIYPAVHYTMGGLWVDYNLMSNLPGLFVLGEANFSDHGANRLGASALMQGLADGYFVLPYTIASYLNTVKPDSVKESDTQVTQALQEATQPIKRLMGIQGKHSPDHFHRELGKTMWNHCGMGRTEQSLKKALNEIPQIREAFWKDVCVPGSASDFNPTLEKASRVADFLEFGELLCLDALERKESCGGHFREEFQTHDGEALRDDTNFSHVAAWEYTGQKPVRHQEELTFENIALAQRSYK
ncbi:MAG: FAD-binding protein, partial [Myxococcaceae bacterium]